MDCQNQIQVLGGLVIRTPASKSLVKLREDTHHEFLMNINLNASTNVAMQGELTHFLHRMTSLRSVVLP